MYFFSGHFLSRRSAAGLIHSIFYAFSETARSLLQRSSLSESVQPLQPPLELIQTTIGLNDNVAQQDVRVFFPDLFLVGFLFPRVGSLATGPAPIYELSRQIWESATTTLGEQERLEKVSTVKRVLRDLIADVDCRAS